jgi:hypothetical protein
MLGISPVSRQLGHRGAKPSLKSRIREIENTLDKALDGDQSPGRMAYGLLTENSLGFFQGGHWIGRKIETPERTPRIETGAAFSGPKRLGFQFPKMDELDSPSPGTGYRDQRKVRKDFVQLLFREH